MSSATKSLELLSYFSATRPEIGLSQLYRLAKRDKATTYRHLQALEGVGFVEQNPQTKGYRLGPALLHLAQIRETTVPRKDGAQAALRTLADVTGETAHVSVLSGTTLYSLMSCASQQHATRAVIDITTHPLHATASGVCTLAFGPEVLFELALKTLDGFTANTPTSPQALAATVEKVRQTGFGVAEKTFEDEIYGISAPIFDQTGSLAGTISVASVASRFTQQLETVIKTNLIRASREITHNWGGTVPARVQAAWVISLSQSTALEPAS
ncbi:MAG: IclR family transcriptional regulator [Sulfitobacter sp.]